MAHVSDTLTVDVPLTSRSSVLARSPAHQAYAVLYAGFVLLPMLAGLDKFSHLLVDWDQYLAPVVAQALNVTPHAFMLVVGVIEIAAGALVAWRPRVGAPVVAAWLMGIIVNLMLVPGYYDVALRDFGLALGAVALWRLSREFDDLRFRA